jgi:hypothetical protein
VFVGAYPMDSVIMFAAICGIAVSGMVAFVMALH